MGPRPGVRAWVGGVRPAESPKPHRPVAEKKRPLTNEVAQNSLKAAHSRRPLAFKVRLACKTLDPVETSLAPEAVHPEVPKQFQAVD